MKNIEKVMALASSQYGVVSMFQIRSLGISENSARSLVKSESFVRRARGVYQICTCPISWHSKALVATFAHGVNARLSHESALINLGLLPQSFRSLRSGEVVEFHVTKQRSVTRGRNDLHRTVYKYPLAKHLVNSIPQVTPEHALIESARHLPAQFLVSVLDSAIRDELLSAESVQRELDKLWPGPGRSKKNLQELLEFYSKDKNVLQKAESILESKILRILSQMNVPKFATPFPVRIGSNKYRLDIAFPENKVAVEVDGFEFHRTRDQFDSDRLRQNDLTTAGWKVVRVTSHHERDKIERSIQNALRL